MVFIYRIRSVISAVEARTGLDELDLATRDVLRFVGEAEAVGESPSCTAVVQGAAIGTRPTTLARLTMLEEDGWLVSMVDRDDGRVKRWRLTPRARRAFSQMSKRLRALSPA